MSGKKSDILILQISNTTKGEKSSMANHQKSEEIAVNRHKIIAPILVAMDEKTDAAKIMLLKNEACEQGGIHRRTLGRWLDGYERHGFEGLKPRSRSNKRNGSIPEDLIREAILLRREVPGRSIEQIIEILEMEGKVPKGILKRTTLQDKLQKEGYSARQMKMYQSGGLAARRFQRKERGDLWHSDYSAYLSIPIILQTGAGTHAIACAPCIEQRK